MFPCRPRRPGSSTPMVSCLEGSVVSGFLGSTVSVPTCLLALLFNGFATLIPCGILVSKKAQFRSQVSLGIECAGTLAVFPASEISYIELAITYSVR